MAFTNVDGERVGMTRRQWRAQITSPEDMKGE